MALPRMVRGGSHRGIGGQEMDLADSRAPEVAPQVER